MSRVIHNLKPQPKNWQKVSFTDIATFVNGGALRHNGKGKPIIKIKQIKEGLVGAEYTDNYLKGEYKIFNGDFLMPWSTDLDIYKWNNGEAYLNQHIFKVVPRDDFDKNFVFYAIKYWKRNLQGHLHGSTMQHIKREALDKEKFPIPKDPAEQLHIASILSAFDDKIELNNKINQTLEQMAQAIFKEWFIDFRFPGYEKVEFVDSEFGRIPKGWKAASVGEVSRNFDNKRIPLSNMKRAKRQGKIPYYGATSVMDHIDEAIFKGEYLLIAEDGTVAADDGRPYLQFIEGEFWVNNHAHVIQGKDDVPTHYLYLTLRNTMIGPYITGAVQLKLTQQNLNKIPVVVPDKETLKQYNRCIENIFKKIRINKKENNKLASLRDLLLPRLMRGGVGVN